MQSARDHNNRGDPGQKHDQHRSMQRLFRNLIYQYVKLLLVLDLS